MRKFLCEMQFDGKKYNGFQKNLQTNTVQYQLELALKKLFLQDLQIDGCSRTDSGVSAKQYYFCFSVDTKLPAERVCYKLNRFLPKDIQCQSSTEVQNDFNLRQNITSKTYEYSIYCGEHIKPLLNKKAVFVKGDLDMIQMQNCANVLVGKHNFKSFCNINADTKTFVRTVQNIKIDKKDDLIKIYVTADGFLYNMVRIIVGTLIECGKQKLNQTDLTQLLKVNDRSKNPAITMPAKALLLYSVDIKI